MPTPDADRVYVQPATADHPERPPHAHPSPAPTEPTVRRLDAVLWYERELLESLVDAHARPRPADDPELARLTGQRREASLLRLVESAQLADELGLPAESSDFACLGGGWATVLSEHQMALGRLARQLDVSTRGTAG